MFKLALIASLFAAAMAMPQLTPAQQFDQQIKAGFEQLARDSIKPVIAPNPGNAAHQLAESRILALQGRTAGATAAYNGEIERVLQAQRALEALAMQQHQQQNAFLL